ncbi:MAG: glucose-1-phosphate thymidylyltransferase [Candidatus Dadabacteria bacterium]|nr:glucose-1-phosphate thymidylyltransferase [Candidatus Dadabacteria bacterium]NIS07992.1 glucose-1-phosphate thymidylyltransferase [Candidatus Dadabacteria bacterium]NIV41909.1 glucose-1-phosphate thymidylyltransferase [Candidatus Dadabacteria bacterium]NIX16361.1 glucose-1-phosphate thymidylyltransferase [Candidatus Dadabacteria bacterium]NIY22960.1 glucose-1-phosphate thymidylyltransferase [Candidatus Dadabacteria bacterium]
MKALVLAGGTGTRLRPLTYTMAKQLVPVANKPIINYVINDIKNTGIKEIGIIVSPETGDQIKAEISRTDWGLNISYIPQDKPLGLAHTVVVAKDFLNDDSFVMYLGDNLIQGGIKNIVETYNKTECDSVIMLKQVSNPSMFGVAEINENGDIIGLVEKPTNPVSDLALVGIYVFSNHIHNAISNIKPSGRGELEITDAIQMLLGSGRNVKSVILNNWWLDTGKKDDLLEANRVVLDELIKININSKPDAKSEIIGRVEIGKGCEISNSRIRGPVVIGDGVKVRDSFIGPYTSIDNNSTIMGSSIEHSVILDSVLLENVQRIEDSIIGKNASVRKNDSGHNGIRLMISDDSEVQI